MDSFYDIRSLLSLRICHWKYLFINSKSLRMISIMAPSYLVNVLLTLFFYVTNGQIITSQLPNQPPQDTNAPPSPLEAGNPGLPPPNSPSPTAPPTNPSPYTLLNLPAEEENKTTLLSAFTMTLSSRPTPLTATAVVDKTDLNNTNLVAGLVAVGKVKAIKSAAPPTIGVSGLDCHTRPDSNPLFLNQSKAESFIDAFCDEERHTFRPRNISFDSVKLQFKPQRKISESREDMIIAVNFVDRTIPRLDPKKAFDGKRRVPQHPVMEKNPEFCNDGEDGSFTGQNREFKIQASDCKRLLKQEAFGKCKRLSKVESSVTSASIKEMVKDYKNDLYSK